MANDFMIQVGAKLNSSELEKDFHSMVTKLKSSKVTLDVDDKGIVQATKEINQYVTALGQVVTEQKKVGTDGKVESSFTKISNSIKTVSTETHKWKDSMGDLHTTITKVDSAGKTWITRIKEHTDENGKVTKTTKEFDGANRQLGKTITEVTQDETNLQEIQKDLSKSTKTLGQSFSDVIGKVAKFYLATLPILAVRKAMTETITTVKEFDKAFTELAKVSKLSGDSLKEYVKGLDEIGDAVARTRTELVDAVTTATKAGFNEDDAQVIAKYSALLQNTFDEMVDGSEATAILVSQLKAFNGEAQDAERILDVINKVSATQAVSSSDLSNALKISSASLATYNNSFEETISLITAGTTIMQGRSQQVARGLQTISARLIKNEEELKKYGVSVKDANGNLLSTFKILEQLKPKWDEMSDAERVSLGNTLAGVNQYKVLASTLSAFDVAIEANQDAMNAQGTTMKQNAVYMDSLQAKITNLKAEFEKLVLGEGGLQKIAKIFIDMGTAILKFANSDIGQLIIKLTALVAGFTLLYKTINGIGGIFTKIIAKITLFTTATAGAEVATWSLKGALDALEINPVVLAITALVGVVTAGIAIFDSMTQSTEEAREELKELSGEISSSQDKVENITKELNDLYKKIKDIQKEKVEITTDAETKRLVEQTQELEKQLKVEKERIRLKQQQAEKDAKKTVREEIFDEGAFGAEYNDSATIAGGGVSIGRGTRVEAIKSYVEQMKEIEPELDKLKQRKDEMINLNETESEEYKQLSEKIDELQSQYDKASSKALEYRDALDEETNMLLEDSEVRQEAKEGIDAYDEAVDTSTQHQEDNSEVVEELKERYGDLAEAIADYMAEHDVSEEEAYTAVIESQNEAFDKLTDKYHEALSALSSLDSAYDTLSGAVDEYNKSGVLSLGTIDQLLSLGSEYLSLLQLEDGQMSINEAGVQALRRAKIEQAEAELLESAQAQLAEIAQEELAGATDATATASANAVSKVGSIRVAIANLGTEASNTAQKLNVMQQQLGGYSFSTVSGNARAQTVLKNTLTAYELLEDQLNKDTKATETNTRAKGGSASANTKLNNVLKEQQEILKAEVDLYDKALSSAITHLGYAIDKNTEKLKKNQDELIKKAQKTAGVYEKEKNEIQKIMEELTETFGDTLSDMISKTQDDFENSIKVDELLDYKLGDNAQKYVDGISKVIQNSKLSQETKDALTKDVDEIVTSYKQAIKEVQEELEKARENYEKDIKSLVKDSTSAFKDTIDEIKDGMDRAEQGLSGVYDKALQEADNYTKSLEDKMGDLADSEEVDALKKSYVDAIAEIDKQILELEPNEEMLNTYEAQLKALEEQNKALEKQRQLEEKLEAMAKARASKVMVYKNGQWQYTQNESEVTSAKKAYDDLMRQRQQEAEANALEQQQNEERLQNLKDYREKVQQAYQDELADLKTNIANRKTEYDKEVKDLETRQQNINAQFEKYLKQLEQDIAKENSTYEKQIKQLQKYSDEYDKTTKKLTKLINKLQALKDKFEQIKQDVSDEDGEEAFTKIFGLNVNKIGEQYDKVSKKMKKFTSDYNKYRQALDKVTIKIEKEDGSYVDPSQAKKYISSNKKTTTHASGVAFVKDNEIAITGENPYKEIVLGSKANGVLTSIDKGGGVVNAKSTKTLAGLLNQIGAFSASNFGGASGSIVTNSMARNSSITIGNISLPSVQNGSQFIDYLQHFSLDMTQKSY